MSGRLSEKVAAVSVPRFPVAAVSTAFPVAAVLTAFPSSRSFLPRFPVAAVSLPRFPVAAVSYRVSQ